MAVHEVAARASEPDLPSPGLEGLVRRARDGDRAAFGDLYDRFVRSVHGVVLAHVGPREAEDLTQEVFVTVYRSMHQLEDHGAFPAWLHRVARNTAIDHLRRRGRAPVRAELPEVEDAGPPVPDTAAHRELAQWVFDRIRSLPEAYRETLVMRLVEGLKGPEIAARTGMTHGSVRVNLTRGMALLRPLLKEVGWP